MGVDQSRMAAGVGRSVSLRPSREREREVTALKDRIEALEKRLDEVLRAVDGIGGAGMKPEEPKKRPPRPKAEDKDE